MIRHIDGLIEQSNGEYVGELCKDPSVKQYVSKLLQKKDDTVTHILSQDLQIISYIEGAKSEIIKELSQTKHAKKAIGAYSSGRSSHKGVRERKA